MARTSASRPHDWLIRQLPSGMLGGDFFVRFVSLFQEEAQTLLDHADGLEYLADVKLAPAPMVRYLAQWIGAPPIDPAIDEARQRALVLAMASALARRGTLESLRIMVEAWTDSPVEIEESGGVFGLGQAPAAAPWLRLRVSSTGRLRPQSLVELVRDEVPAHVHLEVLVAGEQVWATPGFGVVSGTEGLQ
ncbi:phage tail protein [Rarobacter faecitabidus]|uniref:phage tail protein n=1 Tax=Rarobacter faecitabidus TaxID=13243 RepID=UPI001477690C|nr:phage tail protein [Rarobacter faecitabidus]